MTLRGRIALCAGPLRRLASDRRGASATEFALLSPAFGLILAGTLDFGASIFAQFGLNAAVSAGANYAIANGSNLSSSGAAALATTISKLAAGAQGAATVTGVASVNGGSTTTTVGSVSSNSGSAAAADSCYCPTRSGATITWGATATCGAICPGGGYAGKFVSISASRRFTSFLGSYSFAPTGTLVSDTLVQVQ